MFIIFLIIWVFALLYLKIRDMHEDEIASLDAEEQSQVKPTSSKVDNFDRLVRLYIFIFGIVILYKVFYFLIQFFNNLYIGE